MRLLPFLLLAVMLAGCGSGTAREGRPLVVAPLPQVADIARNVAGERAEVRSIVPAGSDPHDFELRPSDAEALAEADVVLRAGEADAWVADALPDGARVQTLGQGQGSHWWTAPQNGAAAAARIIDALAAADPEGAAEYRRTGSAYVAQLDALGERIEACASAVPAARRKLVTTHDSFRAFADRYGFEVLGSVLASASTQAQPSSADLAALAERIRAAGVRTVFPESSAAADVERALAREAGAQLGRPLLSDTLAPPGEDGDTYLGATARNARAIFDGLGAPCEL